MNSIAARKASEVPQERMLARSRPLHIAAARGEAPSEQIASAVLPDAEVVIPLGGLVDLEQERRRLEKELSQVEGRLKGAEAKLANEGFRSKAPAEVVRQAEELAGELERQRAALVERIGSLA